MRQQANDKQKKLFRKMKKKSPPHRPPKRAYLRILIMIFFFEYFWKEGENFPWVIEGENEAQLNPVALG